MYLFKSSFLKVDNVYKNVDLTDTLMSVLLDNFSDGYITLTHTILSGTFYITLENLRNTEFEMLTNLSFHGWLSLNHDKELPTTSEIPKYTRNIIKYSDSVQAGFEINQVPEYMSIDANTSKADKTDLALDKNIADKEVLYKRMLVSVNGFIHRTYKYNNKVMVYGGGETFNNTGINTVGLLSFYDSCDLMQLPIDDVMIARTNITTPLYQEVLLNVGMSLFNKSIILSLGGYLVFVGKAMEVINHETGIIKLKIEKLDIIKLILNSVGVINLDSLGVFNVTNKIDYNKVKVEDVLSDIAIQNYLLLKQSFIIIADCDHIEIDFSDVGITGLPGVYETKDEPSLPMLDSRGVISEYWKTRCEDTWSIRLTSDITKRYMHKTNLNIDNVVINSMSPTHKWYHDDPRFLSICTLIKSHI